MGTNIRFVKLIDGTIVAICSFAGKSIRGEAKCNPSDIMNDKIGTDLAVLRFDEKLGRRKIARAKEKRRNSAKEVRLAREAYERAMNHYSNAELYYDDAKYAHEQALKQLNKFLDNLK